MMAPEPGRLFGGNVPDVVRIGDVVRRSAGPWTPAAHALLDDLETKSFQGPPRVIGVDEEAELLRYVPGEGAAHLLSERTSSRTLGT